jgi:LAS superfamily LD-carboxypeptidase LdcB
VPPAVSQTPTIRPSTRRPDHRDRVAIGFVVAVVVGLLGFRLLTPSDPESVTAQQVVDDRGATAAPTPPTTPPTTAPPTTPPTTAPPTALHPGLVDAFARAQGAAAEAGHTLTITSGFRSAAQQAALLEAEVAERGSLAEARWWVFPPEKSMHVQGLAIDVGDGPAADWLLAHGARFGLCHTLAWEWWHFEWRERWEAERDCPAPADTPDEAPGP